MRVLVIEHDHVSPPGPVGDAFRRRGYDVNELLVVPADRSRTPWVDVGFPDVTAYDALVSMGAPWSTYDQEAVGSWVQPELELLRASHDADIPVLGICFGGQLLATAHGGSVTRSPAPELGWNTVHSDDPSLVGNGPWFQWHSDRWTVPPAAVEVARNAAASQAFVLGRSLAVQFHPELTSTMLEGWLANGGDAAVRAAGFDIDALRLHTRAEQAAAAARAHALVDALLDRQVA